MNSLHILLPIEVHPDVLDAIAARLNRHLYGRAKILNVGAGHRSPVLKVDAGSPRPTKPALSLEDGDDCPTCGGLLMEDRIVIEHGVVVPCAVCRPADFAAFHARAAEREEAEADPWDLSQEEQTDGALRLTLREMVQGEGGAGAGAPSRWRDRGEYDARDDKSDLEAHERTTSYPWGHR